jgi:hypothetical protein
LRRASATALAALLAAATASSCTAPIDPSAGDTPRTPAALALVGESSYRPPIPTKDEVALVDGQPISISGFQNLRSSLKNQNVEAVFWVGVGAVALQNESRARGKQLPLTTIIPIVRYAAGDLGRPEAEGALRDYYAGQSLLPTADEVRHEVERLMARAVVQRNPQVLAALH